jgi:hypothetical protein
MSIPNESELELLFWLMVFAVHVFKVKFPAIAGAAQESFQVDSGM